MFAQILKTSEGARKAWLTRHRNAAQASQASQAAPAAPAAQPAPAKTKSRQSPASGAYKGWIPIIHNGTGWVREDGKELSPDETARLKTVATPPAWSHVLLSNTDGSDNVTIGRDSKGKAQVKQSAAYSAANAGVKWERVRVFHKTAVKPIIRQAEKQMNDAKLSAADRDLGAVVHLVGRTGFRIGSDADTGAAEQAFGASTLQKKHIKLKAGSNIGFDFVGKKGVTITKSIQDKALHGYLSEKLKTLAPGDKVFQADDAKARGFIKKVSGDDQFKAKDFRTWHGTGLALKLRQSMTPPTTAKDFADKQKAISEAVANHLGNTPIVALASYISPRVWRKWPADLAPKRKVKKDEEQPFWEGATDGELTPWEEISQAVEDESNEPESEGDKPLYKAEGGFAAVLKACTCWTGYRRVRGTKPCAPNSCEKDTAPAKKGLAAVLKTSEGAKKAWLTRQRNKAPSIDPSSLLKKVPAVKRLRSSMTEDAMIDALRHNREVDALKKYNEIVSSPDSHVDVFHGTSRDVVESILKQGFLASKKGSGVDAVLGQAASKTAVYVSSVEEFALTQAMQIAQARHVTAIVFHVKVPKAEFLAQFKDDPQSFGQGGFTYKKNIPPEWIEGLKMYGPLDFNAAGRVFGKSKWIPTKKSDDGESLYMTVFCKEDGLASVLKTSEGARKAWATRRTNRNGGPVGIGEMTDKQISQMHADNEARYGKKDVTEPTVVKTTNSPLEGRTYHVKVPGESKELIMRRQDQGGGIGMAWVLDHFDMGFNAGPAHSQSGFISPNIGYTKEEALKNIGEKYKRFAASDKYTVKKDSEASKTAWKTRARRTPTSLDQRLVDFKPDRSLEGKGTSKIKDVLPAVDHVAYSKTPFIDKMHEAMGVKNPMTHDIGDYMTRRDKLFTDQPVKQVPYDKVVVTQARVNNARVQQLIDDPKTGGKQPIQTVRHKGQTYIMNGHHRVVAEMKAGAKHVQSAVLDLTEVSKGELPLSDGLDTVSPSN